MVLGENRLGRYLVLLGRNPWMEPKIFDFHSKWAAHLHTRCRTRQVIIPPTETTAMHLIKPKRLATAVLLLLGTP